MPNIFDDLIPTPTASKNIFDDIISPKPEKNIPEIRNTPRGGLGKEILYKEKPIGYTVQNGKEGVDPFTQLGEFVRKQPLTIPVGIAAPAFVASQELLSKLPRASSFFKKQIGQLPETTDVENLGHLGQEFSYLGKVSPRQDTANLLDSAQAVAEFLVSGKVENLASQKLLENAVKTLGGKLTAAGYGEAKVTIPQENLARLGKYTPSGEALLTNLKSRTIKIPAQPPTAAKGAAEELGKAIAPFSAEMPVKAAESIKPPIIPTKNIFEDIIPASAPKSLVPGDLALAKPPIPAKTAVTLTEAPNAPVEPVLALKLKNGQIISDNTAKLHADILTTKKINPEDVEDVGILDSEGNYTGIKKPDWKGAEVIQENLKPVPEDLLKKVQEIVIPTGEGKVEEIIIPETEQPTENYISKGKDIIGRDIPDWRNAKVYHSTSKEGLKSISKEGFKVDLGDEQGGYYGRAVSFTPDIEYTKQFGEVTTVNKISPNAKILNLNDPKDAKIFDSLVKREDWGMDMGDKILEAGYDGVYDAGAGDLFVYNPKVVEFKGIVGKPKLSTPTGQKAQILTEKPLFLKGQSEEQNLLTFDKLIKGEGFTAVPATPELREFIRNLPENISKREALKLYEIVKKELSTPLSPKEVKAIINRTTGVSKPSEQITMTERTLLKERFKNIARGVREGTIQSKEEIKATQESLIKMIDSAELAAKDRAKFLVTIKNVQTKEQLEKAFPEISERLTKLQDAAERRELLDNIKENITPSVLKNMRPEYKTQIESFVENIGLARRTEGKIQSLRKLAEFIERNPDNQIPQNRLNEIKILSEKPIQSLTTEELQNIDDTIKHFIKLNDLKNNLIIKGKLRTKKEVVNEAINNVNFRHENKMGSVNGLDSAQQIQEARIGQKLFGADSYNAELKTEILDGKDKGIIQEVLYGGIDKGVTEQFRFEHTAEDFFKEKFKGIKINSWSKVFQLKEKNIDFVNVDISGGKKLRITKGERVAFLLHARNDKNLKHLIEGGYSFSETPAVITKITQEDLNKIVSSATSDEVKVADAISEYLNSIQKKAINKVSVNLLGHDIAREEEYFPIRTNSLDRFKDNLIKSSNFPQKTLEGIGIFKERINSSEALIIEDAFVALYKSIKQVGSYVGLAQPLRNAKSLLNDNEFRKTLLNKGLKHYLKSLDNYLKRIEDNSIELSNADKLVTELINKLDVAILGLNPYVAAKQAVSYLLAGSEMDMKHIAGKYSLIVKQEELDEIMKWSPQLRDRFDGNVTRELGELASVGAVKKFFTHETVLSAKLMAWIRRMDRTAIVSIWRAVKSEIKELNPTLSGDEFYKKATERAEEVIRKTQPTFHIKDRSTIGMNKDITVRLLTKYSSQRNKNYMIIRRSYEKYNRSEKTNTDKAGLMKNIALVTVVSTLFILAIDELRGIAYKKEQKKNLFMRTISKFLSVNLGNIYFVNLVADSILSKIEKGTYAGYDVNTTISSFIDSMTDSIANLTRGVQQIISKEEYKAGESKGRYKWWKSIKNGMTEALDVAGMIKGIPVKNIRKLLEIPFNMSGDRQLQKYYDIKKQNQFDYSAAIHKTKNFTDEERRTIFQLHTKIKGVDGILDNYRKIERLDKTDSRLLDLREKILDRIDTL